MNRLSISLAASTKKTSGIITSKRFITYIEKAMGRKAANQFIESMELNSKYIDTPLISVADPANISSWEWSTGLDSTPKYKFEELRKMSAGVLDAFQLVEKDIGSLSGGIKELLGSDHPVLASCAKYFFDNDGGKKIRPSMVLAVSYALNVIQPNDTLPDSASVMEALKSTTDAQTLLAINQANLPDTMNDDDVIDKATTRRNMSTVNQVFGNKLAILGGDFLLSRASVSLARLRNLEVVELLSTVIEHLVKGEIMQMKGSSTGRSALEYYLRKNFYKTASLMGHSCLAAAVLGGYNEDLRRAAYLYGTYVGQAFQLIDDALDFEGSTQVLGKAPLADLRSGLATAPTLFAAEEYPILLTLISRKFESPGDVDEALALVQKSSGLKKCRDLAQVHAERAIEAIQVFPPSLARDSLVGLACKVVTRSY
eukprot:CAMPEP_0173166424 /NCGR_PEP_ID=MMETSP1105-20130129/21999_1 /TAXON_ID=2985 /ORGANISM="Ochromonas sp., Strain BG-1" /LENGTH=426 /DNA_ID=CAMNT_0014087651 /DNA_START=104 /DNA_END=1385 /DNA_ORIENTATION=-